MNAVASKSTTALDTIAAASQLKNYELDKSAEIELLSAFVSLVPRGTYLSDHLQGAVEHFEDMVRQDFCFPMVGRLSQLHQEKVEAEAKLKAVQDKVKEAESKLRQVEFAISRGKQEVAEIRDLASSISHRATQALK